VVANPNCTTAIAAVVLWPIHQRYKIKKIIVSTYQAASGAGSEGMTELLAGTADHLAQKPVKNHTFPHPLPFNVIPQIDVFQVSLSEKNVSLSIAYLFLFIDFNSRKMVTQKKK
jgi:aspartate-semialdehyde dehydrogenase